MSNQTPTLLMSKEEFLGECEMRLEVLTQSKESIETTAEFIARKVAKYPVETVPKLVALWYT